MKLVSLFLALIFSLSSLVHTIASSPANKLTVKAICDKAQFPDKCMSSVHTKSPGLNSADAASIVKILIKQAVANNQAALKKATELDNDSQANSPAKSALDICVKLYGSNSDLIKEAKKALENNDSHQMQRILSLFRTNFETCESSFVEERKLISPLTEYADITRQLVGNSLSIVDVFWPSSILPTSPSKLTPPLEAIPPVLQPKVSVPNKYPTPPTSPNSSVSPSPTGLLSVKAICDKSKYPDFCVSTVHSVTPAPLGSTDATMVLTLVLQATMFNTQTAMDQAKVFAKAPQTDTMTKGILYNSCAEKYDRAITILEGIEKVMSNSEIFKGNLVELINLYSACGNAFKDAQLPSVMVDYDDMLKQLSENNLAIANAFWP